MLQKVCRLGLYMLNCSGVHPYSRSGMYTQERTKIINHGISECQFPPRVRARVSKKRISAGSWCGSHGIVNHIYMGKATHESALRVFAIRVREL